MSHAGLTMSPAACSGAMYSSVPTSTPASVPFARSCGHCAPNALARPKSSTFGSTPFSCALQEDVLRLQVAVHQSLRVRGADGRAHSAQDLEHLQSVHRHVWRKPLPQRLPFEQFHDQKRPGVTVHAEIVDPDDVRMGEAGGRAGLVAEARVEIDRADQVVANQLHGHRPFERFVHGGVDRAHPASSQPAIEPVSSVQHAGAAHGREPLAVVHAMTRSWRRSIARSSRTPPDWPAPLPWTADRSTVPGRGRSSPADRGPPRCTAPPTGAGPARAGRRAYRPRPG